MVRRRKIPVRKHHGVRDPLKQLEEKEKKLRGVINNPPDLKNDQRPSYKFRQFKKLADATKAGKKLRKPSAGIEDKPRASKKKGGTDTNGKDTSVKKFPSIKQLPGEKDRAYMRRVNRITQDSLNEAKYEIKYGVKVVRDHKTGEISIQKKPPNEIDELLKRKRINELNQKTKRGQARRKGNKNKTENGGKPLNMKLAKELIKQTQREEKEERLQEQQKELMEYKREIIPFGEVVHAPPHLTALPRKAQKHETVPRPGRKTDLQLRSLLEPSSANRKSEGNGDKAAYHLPLQNGVHSKSSGRVSPGKVTKRQLQGKRKYLPISMRNMLEVEGQRMAQIYKDLKLKQQQQRKKK